MTPLSSYRVLDLADDGIAAGFLLASLGLEVIAVEPPGGSPSRRAGPFFTDEFGVQHSLHHYAYARGKKSVVLDASSPTGRERLRELIAGADVVLDSYRPGQLQELGLAYGTLSELNPSLVHTSITPFGSQGPRATWSATDLTLMAAAGVSTLAGDRDRAPVRISVPQAWLHASAEAAGATLIALYERRRSGLGQHVDVSVQQAAMLAAQVQPLCSLLRTTPPVRAGGAAVVAPLRLRFVYPASDGHVAMNVHFGTTVGPYTRRLFEWIYEEGGCDRETRDKDWVRYGLLLHTGEEPIAEFDRAQELIAQFTASKTKGELVAAAHERRLLIAPVANAADILANPHFIDRSVWEEIEAPGRHADRIRAPGRFAIFSETPLPNLGAARSLGQDTAHVLAEPRRSPSLGSGGTEAGSGQALDGLKILDFAWVMAGPAATRVLADYGATVVRVESTERMDLIRTLAPFLDGDPAPENSGPQQNLNAGKLGITLDPKNPHAKAVLEDLVRWADVVFDSFAPGAMRAWGLDYDSLRSLNPRIVAVSSSLMGQTGPLAAFAGFGTLAAALAGFHEVTGWPDRDPAGPFSAYTDAVAPRFAVMAILAALEARDRLGEGQFVDLSQAESSLHFYAEPLLDFQLNRRIATRLGNADPECAPHGTYPCQGEDEWIAIACMTGEQWRQLATEMERPDLASDPALLKTRARLDRAKELDDLIGHWTTENDVSSLERALQDRGVPAYRVQTSEHLAADPQLRFRRHFVEVPHPLHETIFIEGSRFSLSRTPARIERAAPTLGQHLPEVLEGLLGYDADRIADLIASGAME